MNKDYDYIVAGAGCAGMSLLMRMASDSYFSSKKILVVDADDKSLNDRTWCFWEKESDIFEPIVHHVWEELDFFSTHFSTVLDIAPYQYKMIRGIDFYAYVKNTIASMPNIEWRKASVKRLLGATELLATQTTSTHQITAGIELNDGTTAFASYVFSSILFDPIPATSNDYHFLQHFTGWEIETSSPVFNPGRAVFMDFRVSQEHGTTFMYVLPTSATTALVEYTLFTESLLPDEVYENAIRDYIKSELKIQNYSIMHREKGVIPMTTFSFPRYQGNHIYIGIAGGEAKASSGYAFKSIQKRTAAIVNALKQGKSLEINKTFSEKKGQLYDAVLLHVLHYQKMPGDEIFAAIFKGNKASSVLSFLDNESSLFTDLKIMSSVPTGIFLPAALQEMVKQAKR
ncbi:lycopene cyclase family protein [Sediminibacterium sp. C3]|uniref:lycopene cyclase family protein n=1 Tax=Sediminibacterium sp. C3 TaxID=1267211 RepID=UPI0003FBCC84|nr:lycopene cyclase family protein [Sediminibacterium sp. C3]